MMVQCSKSPNHDYITLEEILTKIAKKYPHEIFSDGTDNLSARKWLEFNEFNDPDILKMGAIYDEKQKSIHLLNKTEHKPLKVFLYCVSKGGN